MSEREERLWKLTKGRTCEKKVRKPDSFKLIKTENTKYKHFDGILRMDE